MHLWLKMSLLAQAEECIGPGQYDPLLLLVLVLENEVLEKHTPFGKVLLDKLQPLFVDKKTNREALLQEARFVLFVLPLSKSKKI